MSRLVIAAFLFTAIVACESEPKKSSAPPAASPKSEAKPANLGPDPATLVGATAVIETTAGKLTCQLLAKEAPKTVANFVGLAEGTRDWKHPLTKSTKSGVPLYDGTIFHRVIPNFMIQGGDPLGNGTGDPGYSFEDEIAPTLKFDRPGRMAMANSGPDTNGSQFFITEVPTPHLNGRHTIFGQCDAASQALVRKIARVPRDERNDKPFKPIEIEKIAIQRAPGTTR